MNYILSFFVALFFTPIVKQIAMAGGITDKVNGDPLKIHEKPVALLGGVTILVAVAIGAFVGFRSHLVYREELLGIIVAGIWVFSIGIFDDIYGVSPAYRFLVQILAGMAVFTIGVKIDFISIRWVAMVLTL